LVAAELTARRWRALFAEERHVGGPVVLRIITNPICVDAEDAMRSDRPNAVLDL
jgi:hypothetical protein